MAAPIIVDATDAAGDKIVVVCGSAFALDFVLTKNGGSVYDLTGKSVTATIVEEGADTVELDPTGHTLKDQTCTPGAGATAANLGGALMNISTAQSTLLSGANALPASAIVYYLAQIHVPTDSNDATQLLRFGVRKQIA